MIPISGMLWGVGWGGDHAVRTVHAVENGRSTLVTRAEQHWLYHWHRFIDHRAEGTPLSPALRACPAL